MELVLIRSYFPGGTNGATVSASPTTTTIYTVSGTFTNGCKSTSTATITVLKCTSIGEDNPDGTGVKIYPNPVYGELVIESSEQVEMRIYNFAGEEILHRWLAAGKNIVATEQFKTGIYFVKALTKFIRTTTKIIKPH